MSRHALCLARFFAVVLVCGGAYGQSRQVYTRDYVESAWSKSPVAVASAQASRRAELGIKHGLGAALRLGERISSGFSTLSPESAIKSLRDRGKQPIAVSVSRGKDGWYATAIWGSADRR